MAAALLHNPGLLAAGHESAGAEEEGVQAKARLLPRVEVSETASYTTNPSLVFMNLLGQERFGVANFAIPFLNEPDPLTNFNGRIALMQPIYAGGQLRAGREGAVHAGGAAHAREARARQETIFETVRAYQSALLARRQCRVAESAREAARAHLRAAEDLVEEGLAVPSDVMRVKVRLSEIEEMVIRAESGETIARASLEAVMGVKPARPYELVEPPDGGRALPDLESSIHAARESRPDLRAARETVEASAEAARGSKGGRRPQAGLYAAYDINNETLIGSSGQNWTVMVNLSWSILDGGASTSRVRRSIEDEARARAMVSAFEARAELEVRQAHAELMGALARVEASRSAASEAVEGLRIAKDRYESGLATVTDLLDQETALTSARARAAQAEYDRRNGEAALSLAVGSLDENWMEGQP
jgi:outer membrane protein TolC